MRLGRERRPRTGTTLVPPLAKSATITVDMSVFGRCGQGQTGGTGRSRLPPHFRTTAAGLDRIFWPAGVSTFRLS